MGEPLAARREVLRSPVREGLPLEVLPSGSRSRDVAESVSVGLTCPLELLAAGLTAPRSASARRASRVRSPLAEPFAARCVRFPFPARGPRMVRRELLAGGVRGSRSRECSGASFRGSVDNRRSQIDVDRLSRASACSSMRRGFVSFTSM